MTKVIAISGWKRSGKDTVASQLIDKNGGVKISFADPLKEMTAAQYNVPVRYMYEQEFKEQPLLNMPVVATDDFSKALHHLLRDEFKNGDSKSARELESYGIAGYKALFEGKGFYWTPRALLILEGSVKRSVNSNYWTQQAINKIRSYGAYDSAANELYNTKEKVNLYIIPDLRYKNEAAQLKEAFGDDVLLVRINRFDTVDTNDPSERDLDDYKFDLVIENKGTLQQLETRITKLAKDFLK